jgi:hypothetical protein
MRDSTKFRTHRFTIRKILQLAKDKGPIGEFRGVSEWFFTFYNRILHRKEPTYEEFV